MLGLFVFNYINYYKETHLVFAVFLSFMIAFHLLSHRLSAHPHVSCVPPVETSARVALLINHHNHISFLPQKLDFKAKDVFPGLASQPVLDDTLEHSMTLTTAGLWAFLIVEKWASIVHTLSFTASPSVSNQHTFIV